MTNQGNPVIPNRQTRFAILEEAIMRNILSKRPPCENVEFKTPKEVAWVIAMQHWSGNRETMEPINFSGAVLSSLDLHKFLFNGANFSGAILNKVNLSTVELNGANFTSASLISANLREAQCEWALFIDANMMKIDLTGANLACADLRCATLVNAILDGTYLERAHMENAILANANLNNATLMNVNLTDAYLCQAMFRDALLGNAILDGVIADEASFVNAFLDNIQARKVSLVGADLSKANMNNAKLQKAILESAILVGIKLNGADLSGADLREVHFDASSQVTEIKLNEYTKLGDIRWNEVPLIRVDWSQLTQVGDEELAYAAKDRQGRADAYRAAGRAYHGLAVALADQGLNDEASRFRFSEYRMQRRALRAGRKLVRWVWESLLNVVAGRGERPERAFLTYLAVNAVFSVIYWTLWRFHLTKEALTSWDSPIVLSLTSFHGRVFFAGGISITDWVARLGAIEAVFGLFIEIIFIATFSHRFLGD